MHPRRGDFVGWMWAASAGLLVFAARSHEVHLYAGDVPILDQWSVEAATLLEPWTRGDLSLAELFRPHNEHLPTLTRLLALAETIVSGQWDPRIQMTVNAALHASFVTLLVRWLATSLPWGRMALAGTFVTVVAGLPFAWENIAWGFQSQFPFALLCLFAHVHGSFMEPPGSRAWWAAQAAGAVGMLTLGSMWTAPLAVVLVAGWTRAPRCVYQVPLLIGIASLGLVAVLAACGAFAGSASLHAGSLPAFLHAWFIQLSWPAMTVLIQAPVFILALQVRNRPETSAFDRIVLALGVWSMLQAAGIGYARGGGWVGFVSRYGDLLAVGLLANFLAALRLAPPSRPLRWLPPAFAVAWLVPAVTGIYLICTTAHTRGFHDHNRERAARHRAAVDAFLADGNPAHLADPAVKENLYSNTGELARLLSTPGLRALLPTPQHISPLGQFARRVQAAATAVGGVALLGFVAGLIAMRRAAAAPAPTLVLHADPWRGRILAAIAGCAGAGLFLWPRPFVFGEFSRKARVIQASGTITVLDYTFVGTAPYGPGRLIGAARLDPGDLRNIFRGTHANGPEDRFTIRSDSFVLVTPFLIVPFAGDPRAPGMVLEVEVEDDHGHVLATYRCTEAAPVNVGFWELDTSAAQGRKARLVLHDDNPEAWIAAASPQYAWRPGQGAKREQAWRREETAAAHDELGLVLGAGAVGSAWCLVRRRPAAK